MNCLQKLIVLVAAAAGPVARAGAAMIALNPVADTTLFEQNPNHNLGAQSTLILGRLTQVEKEARVVLRFEPRDALPLGAAVSAVELRLEHVQGDSAATRVTVHRMLKSWTEGDKSGQSTGNGLGGAATAGETTWNDRLFGEAAWSVPGAGAGADYSATPGGEGMVSGFGVSPLSGDGLVDDVNAWLQDPTENFGWLLLMPESANGSARHFFSRTGATPPQLIITFDEPPPPAPELGGLALVDELLNFQFTAEAGIVYALESRDELDAGDWSTVKTIGPFAAGQVVSDSAPAPANLPLRIFRLRIQTPS